MNLWIKIIFISLLLFSFNHSIAQDCTATLIIKSDIDDVSIFINDTLMDSGTNFQTEMIPGNYILRVVENSNKWNSKSYLDTVKITDCSEISLDYVFKNEILLDTDPQNVYVFQNDSLVGYTPLLINPNFESLVLQKPNYLNRKISLSDIDPDEKITLDFIGAKRSGSFYESTIFKVLVGTAIALGAATAYFKLEADNRFEEYRVTGDPELLDQTDKLDIISGVSFVALQINFGLIVYLFLSD
jgi:hypothetical protein